MNFDFSAPEYMNWRCGKTKQRCVLNVLIHNLPAGKINCPAGTPARTARLIYDGVTLGIQGGTEVCQKKLTPCVTRV